jgi:ribosomal protein L11 methyltransferase
MDLWEIRAEIDAGSVAAAEELLLESGRAEWTLVEDAVGKRAWVVGVFRGSDEAASRWEELRSSLPGAVVSIAEPKALPDTDWKLSYREHFKAWSFGRLHWVPVWERAAFRLPEGHAALWLDPGMAFGTGNHETTRLCIERLTRFEAEAGPAGSAGDPRGLPLLDAGCGSGILALSASRLGFRDVRGFDVDPEAIRVSQENAAANGLESSVRFVVAGLPGGLGAGGAAVVLANIQADVLTANASALVGAVAPGGLLALSGILASELAVVRDVFASHAPGWAVDSRVLGEWSDLALRRPPS